MSEVLVCCWLNSSGRSRPSVKGGGGSHPDPEITWRGGGWGGGAQGGPGAGGAGGGFSLKKKKFKMRGAQVCH